MVFKDCHLLQIQIITNAELAPTICMFAIFYKIWCYQTDKSGPSYLSTSLVSKCQEFQSQTLHQTLPSLVVKIDVQHVHDPLTCRRGRDICRPWRWSRSRRGRWRRRRQRWGPAWSHIIKCDQRWDIIIKYYQILSVIRDETLHRGFPGRT